MYLRGAGRGWEYAVLYFVLAGAVACSESEERTPKVEATQQAVSDGENDPNDEFPFVVRLDAIRSSASEVEQCSGVLVTPGLVLSSKHCFGDSIDFPLECFGTLFPVGSFRSTSNVSGSIVLASGTTTFTHTYDRNPNSTADALQPVMAPSGNPIQFCTDGGSSHDVALFRLDQRIPTTLVRPLHPPILNGGPPSPSCRAGLDDSDLTITLVGYGPTDSDGDFGTRTAATSEDWEAQDGILEEGWNFGFGYEGALRGDSGGPAISADTGRLCGLNSAYFLEIDGTLTSIAADVETGENQAFLREQVLDLSKTHWVGECNPGDRVAWAVDRTVAMENMDADGDFMPDACDPAPFNAHSDPRGDFTLTADVDEDGVDDAVDNCPPEQCAARDLGTCFNPYPIGPGGQLRPQPDSDTDGFGDSCDSCPMEKKSRSQSRTTGLGRPRR